MKRILLVWPYHRKDWIHVFTHFDRDVEFHYLSYIHQTLDPSDPADRPRHVHYWSDFKSALQVFESIRPSKVIFMSIDSGLSIALNAVAKQQSIPTYILQHGLFTNYRDYRTREKLWRKASLGKAVESAKKNVKFNSIGFLRASLRNPILLFRVFLHAYVSRRSGPYFANRYFSFEAKQPDFYICFSKANARIYEELDRPDAGKFIFTGSPELDSYLAPVERSPVQERYLLHIDQAMAENSFGEETVSKEDMISFYGKLNELALRMNVRLFIKLHPESYQTKWLPQHENITYLRATPDLQAYLQRAELCTGFYSTLMIPAVYWNKVILFNVYYSYVQEVLSKIPHVVVVPFFEFDPSTIIIPPSPEEGREQLKSYFYAFDGKSAERIKKVLYA